MNTLHPELLDKIVSLLPLTAFVIFTQRVCKTLLLKDFTDIDRKLDIAAILSKKDIGYEDLVLYRAAKFGFFDVVESVISKVKSNVPLIAAISKALENNHKHIVQFLLEKLPNHRICRRSLHKILNQLSANSDFAALEVFYHRDPFIVQHIITSLFKNHNLTEIKKWYELSRNLCFQCEIRKKESKTYSYSPYTECVCNAGLKCECRWKPKIKICNGKFGEFSNGPLFHAIICGDKEILNFIQDEIPLNANAGLSGAAYIGDEKLAEYYVSLGANNFTESVIRAIKNNHSGILNLFREQVNLREIASMPINTRGILSPCLCEIRNITKGKLDKITTNKACFAAGTLGWIWILEYFSEVNTQAFLDGLVRGGHYDLMKKLNFDKNNIRKVHITHAIFSGNVKFVKELLKLRSEYFQKSSSKIIDWFVNAITSHESKNTQESIEIFNIIHDILISSNFKWNMLFKVLVTKRSTSSTLRNYWIERAYNESIKNNLSLAKFLHKIPLQFMNYIEKIIPFANNVHKNLLLFQAVNKKNTVLMTFVLSYMQEEDVNLLSMISCAAYNSDRTLLRFFETKAKLRKIPEKDIVVSILRRLTNTRLLNRYIQFASKETLQEIITSLTSRKKPNTHVIEVCKKKLEE